MSQTTQSQPANAAMHDPYDALADLFLGEPGGPAIPPRRVRHEPIAAPAPQPAAGPRIEGLILGHLPVMASAWVQQYARQLATDHGGPVALLRLRVGEATVEMIGSRLGEDTPACPSLDAAVAEAGRHAVVWLVRVDETAEPRLAELPVSGITLLTGANEAALVSSYRTLKNLVRPADDPDGQDLRIVIMGATPDQAAEASVKLDRAAATFLGRPLKTSTCVARIGGKLSALLYRGACQASLDDIVSRLRSLGTPAPLPTPSPQASAPFAKPEPVVSRLGHARAPASPMASPPAPEASTTRDGALARHLAGLRPLEVTCPYAPGVELALDDKGILHLLAPMQTGTAPLLAAAAWARLHHGLLRMALTGTPPGLSPDAQPVLHLFTDDAPGARALADADVRLHLLARVIVAGQSAWFCTPLN
jgi:hypothetical protein